MCSLCENNDIVFLQETWLAEDELALLSNVSKKHYAKGVSSMDPTYCVHTGRPYGGIAILWKKFISPSCNIITFDNEKRLMAIEVMLGGRKTVLINAYLPYCSDENLADYLFYLSKINNLMEFSDTPYVLAAGDFNADRSNQHRFGRELIQFCTEENLKKILF